MNLQNEKYILGNGIVTDGVGIFIEHGALLIEGANITAIGKTDDIKSDGIEFIDVVGRIILPGLVNPHHHLYSSLATGLSPVDDTDSFVKILENLWWGLDAVLDKEITYMSALVGIIDSVKHGVTTMFDHHASMNYVEGSLETIEKAFQLAGIKGVLCFETSDRMGDTEIEAHIDENLVFHELHRDSDTIKGIFGMHANLTLSEETLRKIAAQKHDSIPIHIHCGEDAADLQYSRDYGYAGPVDRLDHFRLLDRKSILAHCIHLDEFEYSLLEQIAPFIVHNPESNANNRVGKMNRNKIQRYILGTDGMTSDMLATLRSAYLLNSPDGVTFDELSRAFFDERYKFQKEYFPNTGEFREGIRADIAVIDYAPLTPITEVNLLEHLIFGAKNGNAYMTISDGKILYRDGKLTFTDESEIMNEAKSIAVKLHERFYD